MNCFRDVTYCSFWKGCKRLNCLRHLTELIRSSAIKANLPLSQYSEKPSCFLSEAKLSILIKEKVIGKRK